MKGNKDFLLREVADSLVLVPVGEAARRFPGMIRLNETGQSHVHRKTGLC